MHVKVQGNGLSRGGAPVAMATVPVGIPSHGPDFPEGDNAAEYHRYVREVCLPNIAKKQFLMAVFT